MIQAAIDPIANMRFMDALAPAAEGELLRHQVERLARTTKTPALNSIDMSLEEVTAQLEEINYGGSYHDVLTAEVGRQLVEESKDYPITSSPDLHPDGPKVFTGNLLVENGHAEYDRVTAQAFEGQHTFRMWKNLWVAEESYHGPSMQEWAKYTNFVDINAVHRATQGYLRNGLTLSFPTTAHGLAYPALQEPATRITHGEVMRMLPKSEKSEAARVGRLVIGGVIADERAHEIFYTNMVRHAFETDDIEIVSAQMLALADAVMGFAMPGMESDIPGRGDIMKAYMRSGAFTPGKLAMKILVPAIDGRGKYDWNIEERTALTDEARQAQADIIDFTEKLKQADGHDRKSLIAIGKARKEYGLVA